MSGGYNVNYRELKDRMKALCIRYADIAKATNISCNTINRWLRSPVELSRKRLIEMAIEKITNDRECGRGGRYTPIPKSRNNNNEHLLYNTELRLRLKRECITQRDIACKLNCKRLRITYLLGKPLSVDCEDVIENAIKEILEERKGTESVSQKEKHSGMTRDVVLKHTLPWGGLPGNDQRRTGCQNQEWRS